MIFALSAVSKLFSMESFELYLFSFGFASFDLCAFAARIVIIAEGALGIWLISGWHYYICRVLTFLFLAVFSAFLIWRMAAGDTDSCHCMGNLVDMNPTQSLIKNLILATILALSWKVEFSSHRYDRIILIVASSAFAVIVFSVNPPDQFYRIGRTSNDLSIEHFVPVADSLGLSKGKRIVCFYSTGCEHCMNCASKMAGIIRRHDIPSDSVSVLFMQTHENEDSLVTSFYEYEGEGLALPYSIINPFEFIPLTNGSMPLVILLEEGKLIEEFDYLSLDEKKISTFLD